MPREGGTLGGEMGVGRSRESARAARLIAVAVLALGVAGPSPASAATQLGETFAPPTGTGGPVTYIQSSSLDNRYTAPFAGVLTSWSFQANFNPQQPLKLKVARHAGGNSFTIVGDSALETPVPGQVNTFATRIGVQDGDVIGLFLPTGGAYVRFSAPYDAHAFSGPDQPPGTNATYNPASGVQLDVSASLEPDADGDGFGDETQDQCPIDGSSQQPCPPNTTITRGPKDRTKKKTAIFEFASSELGSTFECSLDGAAFAACTSGQSFKVGKGKHSFAVRAGSRGQTDPTPATDDWRVKRKKKKRK